MNIELTFGYNRYVITEDKFNVVLSKIIKVKKAKAKKKTREITTYHLTVQQALRQIISYESADHTVATDLSSYIRQLNTLHQLLQEKLVRWEESRGKESRSSESEQETS
ncbi:MAG: hypothetical protein PVI03_07150 [Candidatus Thorarchaeota archaeon]